MNIIYFILTERQEIIVLSERRILLQPSGKKKTDLNPDGCGYYFFNKKEAISFIYGVALEKNV